MNLPEGWTSEEIPGVGTVLARPREIGGGFVTVDFEQRAFAAGMNSVQKYAWHKLHGTEKSKTFSGRGWREKLVADAVAWLEQTMS